LQEVEIMRGVLKLASRQATNLGHGSRFGGLGCLKSSRVSPFINLSTNTGEAGDFQNPIVSQLWSMRAEAKAFHEVRCSLLNLAFKG
jgi:hypothetical protein